MMPRETGWHIDVLKADGESLSVRVPSHRLETKAAQRLLKALVLKYEPLTFEEVVGSSLNRRKGGGPGMNPVKEASYFQDVSTKRAGYALHGPTVSALAWFYMSDRSLEFIEDHRRSAEG